MCASQQRKHMRSLLFLAEVTTVFNANTMLLKHAATLKGR